MMNRWFAGAARDVRRLRARTAARAKPLARLLTGGRWSARGRRFDVRGVGPILAGTAIGAALIYFIDRRRRTSSNVAPTVRWGRAVAGQQIRNARSKVTHFAPQEEA